MAATRRSTALSTVITVMAMLAMTGCQDQTPTDPTVTGIALKPGGGGGKGPKVESTDPTQAPQDTTLNVQVFGSSFDDGSSVTFTLDGTPSDLVETNSTTFTSPKKLIANITIDLNAIEDLYDVEVLSSRGRKGIGADLFSVTKKGKPVEESNYTITDLGLGVAIAISETGIVVGGSAVGDGSEAVLWKTDGTPVPLGLAGGSRTFAYAINGMGTQIVGEMGDGIQHAVRWDFDGEAVTATTVLQPLVGHNAANALGINDAGQISGQSYTSDTYRAVRWEPDGSVTDLGVQNLEGYESSAGWAINNLGWVGGTSTPASSEWPAKKQHAVLWIDDGSGQISALLDLHPVPEIMSIVKGISDVSTDGKVYLAGQLDSRSVVWVVDVATHGVIEHVLEEVSGGAEAVNAAGEVLVSGPAVWTREGGVDLVDPLPQLSKRSCYSNGNGINNAGTVVGTSGVFARGRCVRHAVVWTKIIN